MALLQTPRFLLLMLDLSSCAAVPVRAHALIDTYARATCIPAGVLPGSHPPMRAWNDAIELPDGSQVRVIGQQGPGGMIAVEYPREGTRRVAANGGDYVYPADVRFDPSSSRLYVRCSGRPVLSDSNQTWLFEYNLAERREVRSVLVDPNVLSPPCVDRPTVGSAG